MTRASIRRNLEAAVEKIDFTPPVTVAYCTSVYREAKGLLPAGAKVECYHRDTEVVVAAWVDGAWDELVLPCT